MISFGLTLLQLFVTRTIVRQGKGLLWIFGVSGQAGKFAEGLHIRGGDTTIAARLISAHWHRTCIDDGSIDE